MAFAKARRSLRFSDRKSKRQPIIVVAGRIIVVKHYEAEQGTTYS